MKGYTLRNTDTGRFLTTIDPLDPNDLGTDDIAEAVQTSFFVGNLPASTEKNLELVSFRDLAIEYADACADAQAHLTAELQSKLAD